MPRTHRLAKKAKAAAGARKKRGSLVEIEGVGDLPITLARCCAPIRPQGITGYVTLGRGVTIHRSDCPALARMRAVKPERALNVEWSSDDPENLDVQIAITAYDRRGFVRDISDVMAAEHLSIDALNTVTDHDTSTAHMTVKLAVRDLEQLARVLRRLAGVPNVISARRVH
jgi:GTP pyrophosphokinase